MSDAGRRMLEARLDQAEKVLTRSERMAIASRYASAIMHEVNNPLEAITNLVYLTKLQKDDPEQVLRNMEVVEEQLQTLGRVTLQALSFHREQQEAKDQDLVEIVEAALKLHGEKLGRHHIEVRRRFHGRAVSKVFGSEILQVVSNLLLNAVDALPREGGVISITAKACHNGIHITIADNGPGIPRRFAVRLFEPYVTSKESGTGLGLWLSRRIVEKHGGTFRFRTSETGPRRGTMFRLHFPTLFSSSA